MPFDIGIPELVLIFVVVLIVFGPGRIPELARGLGRLVGDLRRGASELTRDLTGELGNSSGGPTTSRAHAVCPHCSGLNPVGNQFCGHCGSRLSEPGAFP